jgi:hypothetical protein
MSRASEDSYVPAKDAQGEFETVRKVLSATGKNLGPVGRF